MNLNINNKEFLVNYVKTLGLDKRENIQVMDIVQLQELLSQNGIQLEKYKSFDISTNMGFDKSNIHNLSEYYRQLATMQDEKIKDYEHNINDRTSELYEQLYFEADMYNFLSYGYETGKLTKPLTKEEAIEYTIQEIENFEQQCPYWKEYEETKTKFINLEKTVSWDSDEYKNTKQKLEQLEYLIVNWNEEDQFNVKNTNPDENIYQDINIKNGYASKFLDETSVGLTGSTDLFSTKDNKFSLSLGGNMSLYHTISDDKEDFNKNINSASVSTNITTRANIAGFNTNASISRTYTPNLTQGNISRSSSINIMAMRSINSKLFLNGNYSMDYTDNNVYHNISVGANSQLTDTSSVSFDYSRSITEEMSSGTYTFGANYRTPDNKINISGELSYTDGQKIPSVFLKGKIKF